MERTFFGQMKQAPQLTSTIKIKIPMHMNIMYIDIDIMFAENVWNSPTLPRTSKYKYDPQLEKWYPLFTHSIFQRN